jgi:F-type H+-transporting ATPase subunit gamma
MPSMKIIKRRISSVNSTKQIMKAMDLVATSKLQKAKSRMLAIRPMFVEIKQMMDHLMTREGAEDSLFLEPREVKTTAYVLITSDRGLCGGYNANISKEAYSHMDGKQEKLITVGVKGWEYFTRRRKSVIKRHIGISETAPFEAAREIGEYLAELYAAREIDEAFVAYTHFDSILTHEPRVEQILPIVPPEKAKKPYFSMIYEPDINIFLDKAVPMYLNTFIHGAMVEAAACEQAARMTSMDTATHNAEDIIDDLTLMYNRNRQSMITQEINEIVGGANALQ